jgi:predicted CopG family antitoxin
MYTTTMAYRTIGLAEDAYRMLRRAKRPGESFSDAVRRLTGPESLRDLIGTLTKEDAEEFYHRQAERKRKEKEEMRRLFRR